MKQRLLYIITCLLIYTVVSAQEKSILYSHYSFNGLAINPAYTGSHEMLSISLSHRSQWVGFDGAPSFNILGIHTPYKNTRMGLGLLVMNESIGLRKYTAIYANYAHRMNLGRGKLALGLKGGISTGNLKTADLDNEVVYGANSIRYLLPNFGVGAYYYTKKFHAGISVPLLLGYEATETGDVTLYHDFSKYAYYLTAGVKVDIATYWQIEPSGLIEYDKAGGIIADAGMSVLYKDALKVGASYRSKQAVVMLLDFKVNYQLRVGVAYDYGLNELNDYNRSSFELALEYNFGYRIKASNPTVF
ncbi:MAG TPA: type IX secretion system membrane protein PorP/SprF [Bacteroidales bacterium]|jgi:type IX secretion system PorP/SprF family membrane protein|nr:type IX secretion system membrane protein PorP/SprF [Bacteroidales bacterium]